MHSLMVFIKPEICSTKNAIAVAVVVDVEVEKFSQSDQ
jgi:hypothetical protein